MSNLASAFTSKRVWTIIVMFVVSGLSGILGSVSATHAAEINTVLAVLGVIFGLPQNRSNN